MQASMTRSAPGPGIHGFTQTLLSHLPLPVLVRFCASTATRKHRSATGATGSAVAELNCQPDNPSGKQDPLQDTHQAVSDSKNRNSGRLQLKLAASQLGNVRNPPRNLSPKTCLVNAAVLGAVGLIALPAFAILEHYHLSKRGLNKATSALLGRRASAWLGPDGVPLMVSLFLTTCGLCLPCLLPAPPHQHCKQHLALLASWALLLVLSGKQGQVSIRSIIRMPASSHAGTVSPFAPSSQSLSIKPSGAMEGTLATKLNFREDAAQVADTQRSAGWRSAPAIVPGDTLHSNRPTAHSHLPTRYPPGQLKLAYGGQGGRRMALLHAAVAAAAAWSAWWHSRQDAMVHAGLGIAGQHVGYMHGALLVCALVSWLCHACGSYIP